MKAWRVSDKNGEYGSVIVYAETRGKARAAVFHTGYFDDCEWTDLRVSRFKEYDQYYDGVDVVDFWHDVEHRVRLVRDFGWSCIDVIESCCKDCPARQFCEKGAKNEGFRISIM